ncbi:ATP-binding cassette domain-containing protein [Natronosporangium hydrolyticum]|uniref:ATP-binding cassette domain-containing protein n=1 Tax=Natronosporangium hydrolyticum TaxID=2811111 RepID=A0A895YEE4_9ACTN|nr:ATP-binding cassette domain-containing protein [Natronosporangium hydrolyticum]QSB13803.1 ATP-binding cassette domain-containing protein [Natronosporangium hydrolyticum]
MTQYSGTQHSGAIMSVTGVTRRFQRGAETVLALDNVSLELYPGELAVAAGPSGSGKTTLLSLLAGTEAADSGQVTPLPPLPTGVSPGELGWPYLAFVPQALALLDEFTVAENVSLPAALNPAAASGTPSTEELLERLEIGHLAGRYPSLTSGGEQQRTAVARALRLRPPLLLGDEPTGHQDRARVALVLSVLRLHAYHGSAVLISSHDPEVISAADRVITLADGRIVADERAGTPASQPAPASQQA